MKAIIKKQLILSVIILVVGLFFVKNAHAATLSNASDTVSTSRESAAAPLTADQAAAQTQVGVVDNGAQYLASDSAVIYPDTGETINSGLNIASMSAQQVGPPLTRNVYFTGSISNKHHKGDVLIVNITATHVIKFTTTSSVPSGGKIVIIFPGAPSSIASPSASGFSFNGELAVPTDTTCYDITGGQACAGSVASNQSNTYTFTTGVAIPGGHAVQVNIGCTAQSSGVCTTFSSRLINPVTSLLNICTNLGVGAPCTADQYKVVIKTQDASSIDLDTSKVVVAPTESVQVQGTVEPYITFTITGLANGTNLNTQNSTCASTGDVTNSGLDATATFVNLGGLASGSINISAQELSVSTNGSAGYSITATSSGRFVNNTSGFWISDANGGNSLTAVDTPVPAVFPASGNPAYGIHPCGPDVNTGTWANALTSFGGGAKYSNPWNTAANGFYANIASFGAPASTRKTEIEYAASISNTTPAGIYTNVFTYVATPIF